MKKKIIWTFAVCFLLPIGANATNCFNNTITVTNPDGTTSEVDNPDYDTYYCAEDRVYTYITDRKESIHQFNSLTSGIIYWKVKIKKAEEKRRNVRNKNYSPRREKKLIDKINRRIKSMTEKKSKLYKYRKHRASYIVNYETSIEHELERRPLLKEDPIVQDYLETVPFFQ